MGKYMKKTKMGGEVAVMEVSSSSSAPSSMGVRTRAKTLALQKSPPPSPAPSSDYLQLRSRRLQKVLVRPKHQPPTKRSDYCGAPLNSRITDHNKSSAAAAAAAAIDADENAEFSFGENTLDAEARDRSTRESTPCSLIRDANAIDTPGSTTRQRTSTFTNQRIREHIQRNIPTAYEMEEFFACAEQQQQTIFKDKYNFDIVNDVPLPGRYEWVQVHH